VGERKAEGGRGGVIGRGGGRQRVVMRGRRIGGGRR
jgi:hypothetical protein